MVLRAKRRSRLATIPVPYNRTSSTPHHTMPFRVLISEALGFIRKTGKPLLLKKAFRTETHWWP